MDLHTEIQSAPQIVRILQNPMSQMANQRLKRESNNLRGSHAHGWTDWVRAIVPNIEEHFDQARNHGHLGFMRTNMRAAIPSRTLKMCGIYEWQAVGTFAHQPEYVVYVGSTCRAKPGALGQRINEYCQMGSHKHDLINEALREGYELWVRVKTSASNEEKDAEEMENKLLEKYNYAWNKRKNRKIRHILPRR